jgi:hypothetical protein
LFKRSATQVENAVNAALPGTVVVLNEEKPRKGTFAITVVDAKGEKTPIVELLAMPRPFTKLRGTNLEDVASKVVEALKA